MNRGRTLLIGSTFAALLVALGVGQQALEKRVALEAQSVQAPRFEVDPMWPKPLPNGWYQGMTIGVWVDEKDHVWVVHRPDTVNPIEAAADGDSPTGACCKKAPPILEFDPAGNLVGHWGGPGEGYEWPDSNHGIFVDHKGLVWIGGNGGPDAHILKFTRDGKFVKQFGKKGQGKGSHDTQNFGRVAKIFVDAKANEAYIADGYLNKRVAVIDAETGEFKRFWGAYGNKPDDTDIGRFDPAAPPAQQFRTPVHCADLSVDGFVYVCDRPNNRLQIFTKDGKFVKEVFIARESLSDGAVWDVAFSKDPQQKYLYVADGRNMKVYIFDRQSMQMLTAFGEGGRQPGQFYAVHSIAIDSKGNLYTTETYEGRRLQKFVAKGMAPVTTETQGTVWPRAGGK
jgi:DNA-binding beta-propeller fold protein YncE